MSSPQSKVDLITRNLQEVLGKDALVDILSKRDLNIYWGTATTGRPHIAYFVPMIKIADFLNAGCNVTILFADIHASLDNMKAPWDLLQLRTQYYESIIKATLRSINVPLEKLKFVKGSDYQLNKDYVMDMYRLSSMVSEHDAKKAGAEVVKSSDNPLLSGLLYPLLQALDEQYLDVDAQFGGVDQRKIFTFAEEYLPRLSYKKRIHLMNPMVPGLTEQKMSSSDEDSKIDLLDEPQAVFKKLSKVFCEEGNTERNPLLSFAKMVLFPLFNTRPDDEPKLVITRPGKYGGNFELRNYAELESAFANKKLHPGDFKSAIAGAISRFLEPIRKEFENPDLAKLIGKAYPGAASSSSSSAGGAAEAVSAVYKEISLLDLRVGTIKTAVKHPNADSLYVEEIDVGEDQPRSIISGLAKYFQIEELVGRKVIVVCNLPTSTLRGVKSFGMVLLASNPDHSKLEFVEPPADAKSGDKVTFGPPANGGFISLPDNAQKPNIRKVFDRLQPNFKTTEDLDVSFVDAKFLVNGKPCKVASLKGASVS